jgi:NAD(P)H-dependent FMN reductase
MDQTTIAVIVGSTRENRFADKPARWLAGKLGQRTGVTARLLDLRDFPMPFFDAPMSPAMAGESTHEAVRRWSAEIAAADGYVFVTPEYNHAPSAVLKNAIDWLYKEWVRKPAAFVSYGNAVGARAIEQLRLVAVEVQLAALRASLHVPLPALMAHYQGGDVTAALAESDKPAEAMIDDLLWWTSALKRARAA